MAGSAAHWSRIQERGSMWGLRFTVACYRLFGRVLSLPLVTAVVGYFFATDAKGRAASLAYLRRIHARLPEPDWQPGLWQSFRHYREFALSIADRVGLWSGNADAFEFTVHGREHFDAFLRERPGAIFLGAHLGSFDALRVLSEKDGAPVNVLMYTRHAPKINEIFRRISPDVNARVISPDPDPARSALQIKGCIDRGEIVAILADRVEPNDRNRVCEVEFLGERAILPEAPFQLPVILGCPVLLVLALRRGPGRYDVHVEALAAEGVRADPRERRERARELAALYARRLEHHCALAPHQWFNFYDFWAGAESP